MTSHALLFRCLRFLGGLAKTAIPVKLVDEYQALSIDLVEYLSPYEEISGEEDREVEEAHG